VELLELQLHQVIARREVDKGMEDDSIVDFSGLVRIMEGDAGEKLSVSFEDGRLNICGKKGGSELYLQFTQSSVTIARIMVANKRNGVGTDILNWIIDFSKERGIRIVMIGEGATESIQKFALKHGFKIIENDLPSLNWILWLEAAYNIS
jgi:hypothetical protein